MNTVRDSLTICKYCGQKNMISITLWKEIMMKIYLPCKIEQESKIYLTFKFNVKGLKRHEKKFV